MYRTVKATKPSVQVGISPFGIWRPGVPATTTAQLDAYGHLFADSRKWLAEGWCDYLAPQLYWSIQPAKQSFPVLLEWWRAQSRGKNVWPGIATERIGSSRPAREIVDQIALTRRGHKLARPYPLEHEVADAESGRSRRSAARPVLCRTSDRRLSYILHRPGERFLLRNTRTTVASRQHSNPFSA